MDDMPDWSSHSWPKVFKDPNGNWFGVNSEWQMHVQDEWKGPVVTLMRSDGEFLALGDYDPHWRNSLIARPK